MKQRQAVFNAVINVMGKQDGAYQPTTEQRKQIIAIVSEGLFSGEVDFSESARQKYSTLDSIRKEYANGLVSNWLRRDPNLNGGVTYRPTNPGSRTGSQDDQVKAIRALIKSGKLDAEGTKLAQAKLDERIAELRAEKNKVEVDIDQLPADLREQLGL
jgi:hypothetical protein